MKAIKIIFMILGILIMLFIIIAIIGCVQSSLGTGGFFGRLFDLVVYGEI